VLKKSVLSILTVLALLSTIGTLGAQQGRRGGTGQPRPNQGRWNFDDSNLDKRPLAADPGEERILKLLEEIAQADTSNLLAPLEDARLLRMLTETTGAKNVVEVGTFDGYSAMWFCLALRRTGGKITTHEINAKNAALARENFKKAGVEDLVTLVEGDAHELVLKLKEPIDILFIDADKPGYADYLKKLLPLVRSGGMILAHNTTNSGRQMPDYFTAVTADPNLDSIFLGQQSIGIGVTLKKRR
jgi:caffeoyl-CoA O-methyltransferase